jgi:hypothetical protein
MKLPASKFEIIMGFTLYTILMLSGILIWITIIISIIKYRIEKKGVKKK